MQIIAFKIELPKHVFLVKIKFTSYINYCTSYANYCLKLNQQNINFFAKIKFISYVNYCPSYENYCLKFSQ